MSLSQPTGVVDPSGSGPGNDLPEPFATSGPAGSIDFNPADGSDESVGPPLESGPGKAVGSISVGGPGGIIGSLPEGGQGVSVGSIFVGGSGVSVVSSSEGDQEESGQGSPVANFGSVRIQCPNGNLFATGVAGSCGELSPLNFKVQ